MARVPWLAEHQIVQHHDGVGADHQLRAVAGQQSATGLRLRHRQAAYQYLRRFTGESRFVDLQIQNLECHAKLMQQISASGRSGGKEDHSPR